MSLSEYKGKQSFELNGKMFATQDNVEESPIYKKIVVDKAAGFVPSSQTFSALNTEAQTLFKKIDLSPVVGKREAFVLFTVTLNENFSGVYAISARPFGLEEPSPRTTRKSSGEELVGGASTIYISNNGAGGTLCSSTNKDGAIELLIPTIGVDLSMIGYIPMIEE